MNIIKILSKYKRIIIWGDGVYGKMTLHALKANGLETKVICFAKSDKLVSDCETEGVPVYSVYELCSEYKKTLFLVSVKEAYYRDVYTLAKSLGISHLIDARKMILNSFPKNKFEALLRNRQQNAYIRKEKGNYQKKCRNCKNYIVSHVTYPLTGNAGDTYLSWCVRKYLGFDSWNIINVGDKVTEEVIEKINQTDLLIIGGGGLFLPDTNKNTISGWQWAIPEELLESIRIPIIIYAVGYNFFPGQDNSDLFIHSVNALVRKAAFVGLRNNGSIVAIKSILAPELREKVTYQPCITTISNKFVHVNSKKRGKKVALNMAFDRVERRYGNRKEEILMQVVRGIKRLESQGYQIIYVAHCDSDLEFLVYLDREGIKYSKKNLTVALPKEIISFWNGIDCSIGMRGHAQMIPFGFGKKIISLGTHDKMKWFLEDIDMLECYVDLNKDIKYIGDRIVKVFNQIMEDNILHTEKKLLEAQEKLWNISQNNIEKIYREFFNDKDN